mgnify:CR=1 FL=1
MVLKRATPLKKTTIKRKPWVKKAEKAGMSKPKLIKELDAWFSRYIRLKYSDSRGYCRCISCGKVYFWKEIQNGHYMSRRYMSTRFSEDNCRPQGVECNIFNQGAIQMYRRALIKEIGEQRVDLIEVRARQENKNWSLFELKQLIEYYKKEVEKLLDEKNLTL